MLMKDYTAELDQDDLWRSPPALRFCLMQSGHFSVTDGLEVAMFSGSTTLADARTYFIERRRFRSGAAKRGAQTRKAKRADS